MGLFDFLKSDADRITDKYYKNYPRKPYISPNRDFKTWEAMVSAFPDKLVKRSMMQPYSDGLLPGHVYMLYWIDQIHRSRIPEYFEYEYGIDFAAEKMFLRNNGYLKDDSLTDKGKAAIQDHYDVIKERHPEPIIKDAVTISARHANARIIPENDRTYGANIPEEDKPQLKDEISYINRITKQICKQCGLPNHTIQFSRLEYGIAATHYEFTPFTKTGKPAMYPLSVRYTYKSKPADNPDAFGEIFYLQNGDIGKTRQIYWSHGEGCFIYLGQTKNKLVVKKIEQSAPQKQIFKEVVYKE